MTSPTERQSVYGVGRGKVFPSERAKSLLNPLRQMVQSPSRTVRRLGVSPGDVVLELGCGPGYFTGALGAAVGDGRVVALDLQAEMLQLARARVHARHVTFVQGDAIELPFAPSAFDVVVVVLVLGEVPDQVRCIAELARAVREGGRVVFSESWRDSDFIRLNTLVTLVERYGLRFEGRHGPRWEYVASFIKR